jgi:hypothetical protein
MEKAKLTAERGNNPANNGNDHGGALTLVWNCNKVVFNLTEVNIVSLCKCWNGKRELEIIVLRFFGDIC